MSNQTPFRYTWRLTGYCYSELDNFINCADNIKPEDLQRRYCDFLSSLLAKEIKKSTLVDRDVLEIFLADLDNRAQIDWRERHDPDPAIIRGGKMFDKRWRELSEIHGM
jgi:hypothetical protein